MTNKSTHISDNSLYNKISSILEESRKFVATTVNTVMVQTYFEIGRLIVEEEQHGNVRAEYGKETLKNLSIKLTAIMGKDFLNVIWNKCDNFILFTLHKFRRHLLRNSL